MAWWNKVDYCVESVRRWISEGKTQAWIGKQYGVRSGSITKLCKREGIKCQRTGPRVGDGHPKWKGGRLIDKSGYVLVYTPNHPYARKPRKKYVPEHRLVMEKHLGRYLTPGEVVHHKNRNPQDNRIENLELFARNALHLKYELNGKVPRWTEDGKRRIQLGVVKAAETHRKLVKRGCQNTQTTPRS